MAKCFLDLITKDGDYHDRTLNEPDPINLPLRALWRYKYDCRSCSLFRRPDVTEGKIRPPNNSAVAFLIFSVSLKVTVMMNCRTELLIFVVLVSTLYAEGKFTVIFSRWLSLCSMCPVQQLSWLCQLKVWETFSTYKIWLFLSKFKKFARNLQKQIVQLIIRCISDVIHSFNWKVVDYFSWTSF